MKVENVVLFIVVVVFAIFTGIQVSYAETEAEMVDNTCPVNVQDQDVDGYRAKIRRDEQNILRNAEWERPKQSIFTAARERFKASQQQLDSENSLDSVNAADGSSRAVSSLASEGSSIQPIGKNAVFSGDFDGGIQDEAKSTVAENQEIRSADEISESTADSSTAQPAPSPMPAPRPLPSPSTIAENTFSSDSLPLALAHGGWVNNVAFNSRVAMYQRVMGP